ncbi:hypothetical protein QCA50_020273 [Cerrena zonata]|uniref:F-box domain-containing protein n=1 Tax=Cerrena zonata TaxID=2478898 RepID=A0AAW0FJE0_9APHY
MTFGVDSDSHNDGILDSESDAPNEQLLELTRYHEHEVYKHQHHIAALSRAVNSKRPVSTLSDELLVDIFLCYRDISIIAKEGTVATNGNQDEFDFTTWWWLVPTHVCHYWRMVALASPLLWRYLDDDVFSRPHLLDAALSRSYPAPLDISIQHALFASDNLTSAGSWNADEKESLGKIMKESYRTRTLHIDMPRSLIVLQITQETSLPPFVILEDLHINALTPFGEGIPIPAILNSLPCCLRSLSLKGVVIDWEMLGNLPPTVTSIQIIFPPRHPSSTCETILDVLARLPKLECLCLNKLPIGTQQASREVHLPRLKKLNLSQAHSWNILSIIQSLSFPPGIDSTIGIKFNPNNATPPLPLSSVFSQFGFSSLPEHTNAKHLLDSEGKIKVAPRHGLSFETFTETDTGSWPRYFKFKLMICNERPTVDTSPWLEFIAAISHVVYPKIRNLLIGGGTDGLSGITFADNLLRANQLETLQMKHSSADRYLLEALRVLPDGTVPVPRLRRVKVWSRYILPAYHINGEELCEILEDRRNRGYRLEEITINEPHLIDFNLPGTRQRLGEVVTLMLI